MSAESFTYETRQTLQAQLSDGELTAVRELVHLIVAIWAGIAAVMGGRRASRRA